MYTIYGKNDHLESILQPAVTDHDLEAVAGVALKVEIKLIGGS